VIFMNIIEFYNSEDKTHGQGEPQTKPI
jgi:hypothetical protein